MSDPRLTVFTCISHLELLVENRLLQTLHYFAKNGMAIFLPIEPRVLTSSDSRSVAASVILWGPSDVLASFQKPSSKSVEIYRAIISHLLDLIATTAQSGDLLIFGGNGNATLDSILVRPSLSERKPPTTKTHQTWAPCTRAVVTKEACSPSIVQCMGAISDFNPRATEVYPLPHLGYNLINQQDKNSDNFPRLREPLDLSFELCELSLLTHLNTAWFPYDMLEAHPSVHRFPSEQSCTELMNSLSPPDFREKRNTDPTEWGSE
ncbi:hypothetical protein PROFUN_07270 [Planoprotostelium fungivorum]|uniref:Uncharacterized protein n=1 Tax=Planoprotostelium fungivorum TaxID=1890364 RepID=A0A2P6NM92_9EUKA|nr:hypothetical protein PROFUN_07270 [Planoprotostelium fungivorum]